MKRFAKIFATVSVAAVAAASVFAFASCSDDDADYYVYMPDGAPALAMAQLMAEDMGFGYDVQYEVVNAGVIQTYVTGDSPEADVCILPVNQAAQLLGSGEVYQMLGTVTHGNLYMISAKFTDEITAANLSSLTGKTVGCIQLNNFVGYVFRMILEENGVEYAIVESVSDARTDMVNLINIANPATQISPSAQFDYMIAAEPVVTAKTANSSLEIVGNLQQMFGADGYPQAVMVAKTSVIENNPQFIADLTDAAEENAQWIAGDNFSAQTVVDALNAHYGGATSSVTVGNLTADTVSRCAIEFVPASQCRQEVLDFIGRYGELLGSEITVSDSFFYTV